MSKKGHVTEGSRWGLDSYYLEEFASDEFRLFRIHKQLIQGSHWYAPFSFCLTVKALYTSLSSLSYSNFKKIEHSFIPCNVNFIFKILLGTSDERKAKD